MYVLSGELLSISMVQLVLYFQLLNHNIIPNNTPVDKQNKKELKNIIK